MKLFRPQLTLIPRIEVTTIAQLQSPEVDNIKQDFDYYNCNHTYYEVNYDYADEKCKQILNWISMTVYNGASCEYLNFKMSPSL